MKVNTVKYMRPLFAGAIAAISLLAPVGLATAGPDTKQTQTQTSNRGQFSAADYKFVTEAAEGGKMEVTLGQLATQKGMDKSVQDFGKKMVEDHTKVNQQLAQLAAQKGATLPTEAPKHEQKALEHLQGLSGAAFDKAYIDHMVSDHKKDIKEFTHASKSANDPELQAFASKTLPILQEHLRLAQEAQAAVNAEKKSTL